MLAPMLVRRSGVSCVAHRGCLYVIGGFNGLTRMNSGEKYEISTKSWTMVKEMFHPRSNFGLEIIDDMVMAIGGALALSFDCIITISLTQILGFNGIQTISHCECYIPEKNEWVQATDMGIIRSALTSNRVSGLQNILEYIHLDRQNLAEDRRRRVFEIENQEVTETNGMDESVSSFFMAISVDDIHHGDISDEEEL